MKKVIPLSIVMSLLSIFAGLTASYAESHPSSAENTTEHSHQLPLRKKDSKSIPATHTTVDTRSVQSSTLLHIIEKPSRFDTPPFPDPRHRLFVGNCPFCGMG